MAGAPAFAAGRPDGPLAVEPAAVGGCLVRVRGPGGRLLLRTGGVVASEPYDDDPGWADVPDHHLVDVADGVVTVTELEA